MGKNFSRIEEPEENVLFVALADGPRYALRYSGGRFCLAVRRRYGDYPVPEILSMKSGIRFFTAFCVVAAVSFMSLCISRMFIFSLIDHKS